MGQLEERTRSVYERKLEETRLRAAEEARAHYLQCLHQLVNSKGTGSREKSDETGVPRVLPIRSKKSEEKKMPRYSSSPKRAEPVSRVEIVPRSAVSHSDREAVSRLVGSQQDREPGVSKKQAKSSSKKEAGSHKIATGKPCQVGVSKFVPRTKLILHTETRKSLTPGKGVSASPAGVYWAREKDRKPAGVGRVSNRQ